MTWVPMKVDGRRHYTPAGYTNRVETLENLALCAAAVPVSRGSILVMQCRRRRGHGPGGEFCRQHAAWMQRRTLREVGE